MSETNGTPKSIVTKLAEVMGEVERVAKRGRNDFHKYDYVTEADIAAAVREHMAARHLMMVPSVESMAWRADGKIATLGVRFTVYDGDSGETLPFLVYGEGQDSGDKATYKAMTGANKYALLKLFQIPTGDDPEREDKRADGPKGRAAQREAMRDQSRRDAAEHGPYAERERQKVIDKTTGEVLDTGPVSDATSLSEAAHPAPTLSDWPRLHERMKGWTEEARKAIPPDEALYLMPEPEAEQNRETYIAGIREAAARRGLTAKEQTDIKERFTGSRQSSLANVNIYVLRALWIEMDPEMRG